MKFAIYSIWNFATLYKRLFYSGLNTYLSATFYSLFLFCFLMDFFFYIRREEKTAGCDTCFPESYTLYKIYIYVHYIYILRIYTIVIQNSATVPVWKSEQELKKITTLEFLVQFTGTKQMFARRASCKRRPPSE